MLILNMILRITGFTQEKLANYIGVSRASINSWLLNDSSMTETSKKMIANKFGFPIVYFDVDLNQDLNIYKIVFSTIYENWKKYGEIENRDDVTVKINEILNDIESDIKRKEIYDISDIEILEGLSKGYNPFTGEVFEDSHILKNVKVKNVLERVSKDYNQKNIKNSKEDLSVEELALFEKLRKWRKAKYKEEGYYNAYYVFSDKEIINIVLANISEKEDLLKVKGIGSIKYGKYADDIYKIIANN